MTHVRTVIVDDERLARAELRRLLSDHPDVEVVGEAARCDEAAALVAQAHPDLLLLDVQMPAGSGFDLLERLPTLPAIVFTTAHDQYALRAFEVSALDYLLKPVGAERLARALERVRASMVVAGPGASRGGLPRPRRRIFVRDGQRCWLMALDEIALLESEGNYTAIHYGEERPLVLGSLNQLEARLDREMFFRASRKHLINLGLVVALRPTMGGGLRARLRDGQEVAVSRRQAQELRRRTGLR